jgi:hypothetical protein
MGRAQNELLAIETSGFTITLGQQVSDASGRERRERNADQKSGSTSRGFPAPHLV